MAAKPATRPPRRRQRKPQRNRARTRAQQPAGMRRPRKAAKKAADTREAAASKRSSVAPLPPPPPPERDRNHGAPPAGLAGKSLRRRQRSFQGNAQASSQARPRDLRGAAGNLAEEGEHARADRSICSAAAIRPPGARRWPRRNFTRRTRQSPRRRWPISKTSKVPTAITCSRSIRWRSIPCWGPPWPLSSPSCWRRANATAPSPSSTSRACSRRAGWWRRRRCAARSECSRRRINMNASPRWGGNIGRGSAPRPMPRISCGNSCSASRASPCRSNCRNGASSMTSSKASRQKPSAISI